MTQFLGHDNFWRGTLGVGTRRAEVPRIPNKHSHEDMRRDRPDRLRLKGVCQVLCSIDTWEDWGSGVRHSFLSFKFLSSTSGFSTSV